GVDAASRQRRAFQAVLQRVMNRDEVVTQPGADGREADISAVRAIEQASADLHLELGDHLTDPRLRDVQSLRGAAEVQFLGEGEEDLDVSKLHCVASVLVVRSYPSCHKHD